MKGCWERGRGSSTRKKKIYTVKIQKEKRKEEQIAFVYKKKQKITPSSLGNVGQEWLLLLVTVFAFLGAQNQFSSGFKRFSGRPSKM